MSNSFAEVHLPESSKVDGGVTGDACSNADLAKRSAMINVCKILHRIGQLNDYLLPHSQLKGDKEELSNIFSKLLS